MVGFNRSEAYVLKVSTTSRYVPVCAKNDVSHDGPKMSL